MTNAEAREKLCPFSFCSNSKFCQGTGCMAFRKTHNEVKIQNHGQQSLEAIKKYTEARGRTLDDVEQSVDWLVLQAEYDCVRLFPKENK